MGVEGSKEASGKARPVWQEQCGLDTQACRTPGAVGMGLAGTGALAASTEGLAETECSHPRAQLVKGPPLGQGVPNG